MNSTFARSIAEAARCGLVVGADLGEEVVCCVVDGSSPMGSSSLGVFAGATRPVAPGGVPVELDAPAAWLLLPMVGKFCELGLGAVGADQGERCGEIRRRRAPVIGQSMSADISWTRLSL